MINVKQVEIFYYVVRAKGIAAAVKQRSIPWSIGQPGVSGAMKKLEAICGSALFERGKEFRLTPRGADLFELARPFFEGLDRFGAELNQTGVARLRIACSHVAHHYLRDMFELLQRRFPTLQVRLRSGSQHEMKEMLRDGAVDILIAPIEGDPPAGTKWVDLATLAVVLLIHRSNPLKSAAEVWELPSSRPRLAWPDTSESITGSFSRGLATLGIKWEPAVVADSLLAVTLLVAQKSVDFGLSVDVGPCVDDPDLRAIPLPGFEPIRLGLAAMEPPPKLQALLIEALVRRAKLTFGPVR